MLFRLSPLQLAFSNFYFAIFFSFLFYFTFLISSHCVVFVTYSFYFTFHLTLLMGSCLLSQSLIIIIIIIIIIINKAHASFHPMYLHGCLNFVRAAPYVLPLYLLYISLWKYLTIVKIFDI
jgi:hypothetical protein